MSRTRCLQEINIIWRFLSGFKLSWKTTKWYKVEILLTCPLDIRTSFYIVWTSGFPCFGSNTTGERLLIERAYTFVYHIISRQTLVNFLMKCLPIFCEVFVKFFLFLLVICLECVCTKSKIKRDSFLPIFQIVIAKKNEQVD